MFSKIFRLFKPVGSHKRIVKLMELKQSIGIVIILLFVLFEVGMLGYLGNKFLFEDSTRAKFTKNIAIININETITSKYVERIIDKVEEIKNNKDNFVELLVVMNSGGGSPTASEELREYFDDIQKEGFKITMYIESIAASGAYYIATTAKKKKNDTLSGIIANKNAIVGSIGVILPFYVVEEAAKKLGVKENTITMGKYKQPLSPFKTPSTQDEKYMIDRLMKPVYNNFLKMVAKGRDMSVEKIEKYADGQIFVASEVEGVLVDRVSYLYKIKKELKKRVQDEYKEDDVGFVKISTAKKRKSLLDTKINIELDASNLVNSKIDMR